MYQRAVDAYDNPDPAAGKTLVRDLVDTISNPVPAALQEACRLGRTFTRFAADILACFDRPHTTNRPAETINGRLEYLRGSALSFENLTSYIARSLPESDGFRPQLLHRRTRRVGKPPLLRPGH